MNEEKDFFKTCFNTVAGLEVKNESQTIAKEVVLSEVGNLQEENKQLKATLEMYENGVYFSSENDKLQEENQQLKIQISAREEEYRRLEREFQELKLINKEYERLNKENGRGFKITSVEQYNIDELVKYKNNWNELKEWVDNEISQLKHTKYWDVQRKMQELERGVSDVR